MSSTNMSAVYTNVAPQPRRTPPATATGANMTGVVVGSGAINPPDQNRVVPTVADLAKAQKSFVSGPL